MQVPPVPPVPLPNALPQDAVAKALPQAQIQAAQPILQRAIDPSQKSDRGRQARSNSDRAKGGGMAGNNGDAGDPRGGSVNLKV